jgi:hypothetical protein
LLYLVFVQALLRCRRYARSAEKDLTKIWACHRQDTVSCICFLATLTLSILSIITCPPPSTDGKRPVFRSSTKIWTVGRIFYSTVLNDRIVVLMKKCDACGKEHPSICECQFCHKVFCPDDYARHMAWERRHEGLAEESSKLWRRKRH